MNQELVEWSKRLAKVDENGSLHENHAMNQDFREGLTRFYNRIEQRIGDFDRRLAKLNGMVRDGIPDVDEDYTQRVGDLLEDVRMKKANAVRVQLDVEGLLVKYFRVDVVDLV